MEIILIILTGLMMGCLLLSSFYLGYLLGGKQKDANAITLTKDNVEYIRELTDWMNYKG